jgi:hypothetical protein
VSVISYNIFFFLSFICLSVGLKYSHFSCYLSVSSTLPHSLFMPPIPHIYADSRLICKSEGLKLWRFSTLVTNPFLNIIPKSNHQRNIFSHHPEIPDNLILCQLCFM